MRNKLITLLITSLLLFCFKSKAQFATPPGADLQEKAAGYELVKATRHYYTGTILSYGGGLLFLIGSAEISSGVNGGLGLIVVGGLAAITGTVFTIESYSHIGRQNIYAKE